VSRDRDVAELPPIGRDVDRESRNEAQHKRRGEDREELFVDNDPFHRSSPQS